LFWITLCPLTDLRVFVHLKARSRNCEKRLLASSFLSVSLSVCNSSAVTGRIFVKFDIWIWFENLSKKFEFHWNWRRIAGTLCETNIHLWWYFAQFFLEWETFWNKIVLKIKTHISCTVAFFFFNRAVYEIMLKIIAEPGRLQMTMWRMRISG